MWMSNYEPEKSPSEKFLKRQAIKNIRDGINIKGGTGYLMSLTKRNKNKKKRKK